MEVQAWVIEHDSHGLYWDTLVFLPVGDDPETDYAWVKIDINKGLVIR